MSIRLLLLISFSLVISKLSGQDFNNYTPLKSQGKLPADFITLSSETYKKESEKISRKERRAVKKSKESFYLENSFRLREVLYSGKVLFNDPVTTYLNKVADQLLINDQALRKKIRIYAVKTPYVNAFATNSGIILVNIGLISQLENEAQLAFILAHEIIHYKKEHVLDSYIETKKIQKNKGVYKELSVEEKYLAKNNYSKEKETEADLDGIEIFLKSDYSTDDLLGVFDVLQYSYLPFDDILFPKAFFETKNLVFPSAYFLEETKPISIPENEDDSKSTHPSIVKRRNYISNRIASRDNKDKKNFIVSKEEFYNIRKISRYEVAYLYMQSLRYEEAIYQAYLLLRKDPENLYLQKIVGKSLYALSKYYNEDKKNKVHKDFEDVEGKSQQVYHFFENIKANELNVLALKYLWNLKKKYPEDKEIELLTEDIFKDLVFEHFERKEEFSYTPKQEVKKSLAVLKDSVNVSKLSKYDKIKLQQEKQKAEEDHNFVYFAFVNELQDPAFNEKYNYFISEKEKEENKKETKREKKERIAKARKERRLIKRKGHALGVEKVVVFNPFYYKVDHRKKQVRKFLKSEEAQLDLNNKISENCRKVGINYEVIDDVALSNGDLRQFNDLAFLNNWMLERLDHINNEVEVLNLDGSLVTKIKERYNTKYFCWLGVVNERNKKTGKALAIVSGILFYPILPFSIGYVVTPDWDTSLYSLLLDIETGKIVYAKADEIEARDANYILNSSLYDLFYQIHNSRK